MVSNCLHYEPETVLVNFRNHLKACFHHSVYERNNLSCAIETKRLEYAKIYWIQCSAILYWHPPDYKHFHMCQIKKIKLNT